MGSNTYSFRRSPAAAPLKHHVGFDANAASDGAFRRSPAAAPLKPDIGAHHLSHRLLDLPPLTSGGSIEAHIPCPHEVAPVAFRRSPAAAPLKLNEVAHARTEILKAFRRSPAAAPLKQLEHLAQAACAPHPFRR